MIPNTTNLVAHFKTFITGSDGEQHPFYVDQPIAAWSNDCEPLVAGKHSLKRASGDYRIGQPLDPDTVAVIPAGGWRVERTLHDGTVTTAPLVGWAVTAAGTVTPLDTDVTGYVEHVTETSDTYRIYHPDETEVGTPRNHDHRPDRAVNRNRKGNTVSTTSDISSTHYHVRAVQNRGGTQERRLGWDDQLTHPDAEHLAAKMLDADTLDPDQAYAKYGERMLNLKSDSVAPGWEDIWIVACDGASCSDLDNPETWGTPWWTAPR